MEIDRQELDALGQMIEEFDDSQPHEARSTWAALHEKLRQVLRLTDAVVESMHECSKFSESGAAHQEHGEHGHDQHDLKRCDA